MAAVSSRLRIAIYMRLSKGDHTVRKMSANADSVHGESETPKTVSQESAEREIVYGESNSIQMQRELLREFVAARFEGYELLEFEDDGYSGTNFNRPGVGRLLDLVRGMEVDCIVVKDFSRFSRDYIELGAYLEQIFPFMGVRFISVNDGYDSAAERYMAGELDISFKNLLYDLYSKDLSVKVKSALSVRKEQGQYISSNSPFGYMKSGEDRHQLLIAEDEAAVVRRIFNLALQGCSSGEIARLFNREGIKTPLQFRVEKGETGRRPKKGIFIWQTSTVCQILHNQVYVGDLVYGKTEKETVGGMNHLKPQSEWKVYADHHAPVIDRQTFQMLQEGHTIRKGAGQMPRHVLIGKLVCGCCGRNLRFRKMAAPCFVCPYRYTDSLEGCVEKVDAVNLGQYVLSEMQDYVIQMEGEENLKVKCREIAERKRQEWKKRKRHLQREQALLKKHKLEIYEVYSAVGKNPNTGQAVKGELPDEEDFAGKKSYTGRGNFADEKDFADKRSLAGKEKNSSRESILQVRLAEAERKELIIKVNLAEAEEKIAYWDQVVYGELQTKDMMGCLGLTELTRQNVEGLIDKIIVCVDERKTSSIKIHWAEWDRGRLFQHLCNTGGN